jgi:acetyl-CoA carboxylase biotin carboxylase subunit
LRRPIRKVLVANRGEIAVRLIRACRDLGLATVAVYSECDRRALHVRLADEGYFIGANAPRDSYLRIDTIVEAATRSGADAVHPGYGFLAENGAFADAVRAAGLVFIGPAADVIRAMGSKTAAREAAMRVGVPVVPGTTTPLAPDTPDAEVAAAARGVGFPLMLKAVAGGGGKGMRLVESDDELGGALRAARSEALSAFGDGAVYLERRLARPRHIEVQLLGDEHGTVLPFVERECSVQRRHQKVLEESPSPAVGPELRHSLANAAARVASEVGYTNAGTIEFLLEEDGRFYFLEMNTRLQVEHPITELVTGIDLVHWQIRIAQGEPLTLDPVEVLTPRGHAIEARIYAEDPDNRFLPSPGPVTHLRLPSGPGVRNDSGLASPGEVPIYYDPLVSKLSTWGSDRPQAVSRLTRALREYEIEGIRTTIPFFGWLLRQDAFLRGQISTTFLDEQLAARAGAPFWDGADGTEDLAAIALAVELHAHPRRQAGRANSESTWQHTARREALL